MLSIRRKYFNNRRSSIKHWSGSPLRFRLSYLYSKSRQTKQETSEWQRDPRQVKKKLKRRYPIVNLRTAYAIFVNLVSYCFTKSALGETILLINSNFCPDASISGKIRLSRPRPSILNISTNIRDKRAFYQKQVYILHCYDKHHSRAPNSSKPSSYGLLNSDKGLT
jgi:hypothetical protein